MRTRTPRTVTPEIIALCEEITGGCEPQYLDISSMPGAVPLDCFLNVERQVRRNGGRVCYGWLIWEMPWAFIEAEFHAVWRDPHGALVDITPRPTGITRVLFLPDPVRGYFGQQVNNVRRALTSDPAIYEFLRAADDRFVLMNRGTRVQQSGPILLSPAEAKELEDIQTRISESLRLVARSLPNPKRRDPCPCGSGKRFRDCHGS